MNSEKQYLASRIDAQETAINQVASLTAQLAAMTAERDVLAYAQSRRDQSLRQIDALQQQLAASQARVGELEEALKPLSELLISADAIECALKRLGPIALRDEAYVKVATETLIRIMRAITLTERPPT